MIYTSTEVILMMTTAGSIAINIIQAWRTGTKVAVIEGHVNSERAKLNEQLLAKAREIEILTGVISEKDRTAALLAQSIKTLQLPG